MVIVKLLKYLSNTVILALMVLAGLFAAGHFELINFYKPFVVLSGSMEPSILTGSVVLVQPKEFGYMEGDVITFMTAKDTPPTTHRIIGLQTVDGDIRYQTQGDANDDPDGKFVDPRNVIGHVFLSVPYIGYLADLAGKPIGFVALVVIPATIIIYEELKTIKREIIKALKGTSSPPEKNLPETDPPVKSKNSLLKILKRSDTQKKTLLSLGFFLLLMQTFNFGTTANYNDLALVQTNSFGAAADFGSGTGGIELPLVCARLQGQITLLIEGSGGNDRLRGTAENELILGHGGKDNIDGGGGDDCILGGDGDDKIDGGSGNDIISGEAGKDDLDGGSGDDLIYGGVDNDDIKGGGGVDTIYGDEGNDEIDGDGDGDIIRGGVGNDNLKGGSGFDDMRGNQGDDELDGGSGDDLLSGGDDFDILDGGSGTDTCLSGEDLDSCEL